MQIMTASFDLFSINHTMCIEVINWYSKCLLLIPLPVLVLPPYVQHPVEPEKQPQEPEEQPQKPEEQAQEPEEQAQELEEPQT